ncbi:MAG TPA: cytochrome C oxidase subunit IV family protein [Thermoanaerobaculia bacterium]|nr:cytochrome C oxidase subunit IV family protein [Thermoanaerobaculia bacterium]
MSHNPESTLKWYIAVFLFLMVMTGLTVAVAKMDLGAMNDVVMLVIAVAKALAVILIFMHVKDSTRVTALTVVGGFVWLGILIFFTLNDYLSRGDLLLNVPGK